MDYRDRNKPLTAEDLVRRYNLDNLTKMRKAIRTLNDGLTKTDTIIENFILRINGYVKDQVDNMITAWFFHGLPTLENKPFIEFKETASEHVNDFYYDRETGKAYQLQSDGNSYLWTLIEDNDLNESMAIASASADTADNKRNIFYTQPTPPYQVGDIWYDNAIKRCRCSRSEGEFNNADWTLQKDYMDESVLLDTQAILDQFKESVEENYATIVKLESTKEDITARVESNTTEIRNNQIAINEKLNDYATNTTVTEQINSVESKVNSNEASIKVVKETLENGISKVKTEKGYTFSDDGLKIDDPNSKVKNVLDENGMDIIEKSTGDSLLFAGYDKDLQETLVKSKNMVVEKYLVVPNSRYESYNNPKFGIGTGCFDI